MIRLTLLALAVLLPRPLPAGCEVAAMSVGHELVSFNHQRPAVWHSVDDGVMGGLSSSFMRTTAADRARFVGTLSLANNGGFASVRTTLAETDLTAWTGLEVQLRGDGRTYQLRLRNDGRFDGVAYRALLPTRADEWLTVHLPFTDFEPTFRGRILQDVPALDTANIVQLTLMVADKQPGAFALEIASIRPWFDESGQP